MQSNQCDTGISKIESEQGKIANDLLRYQVTDENKQTEAVKIALDALKIENDSKELKNKDLSILIAMKQKYAKNIFCFICVWSVFVGIVLISKGINSWNFNLSDTIIITLISSSFVQVIGLMYIVLNHIFPKDDNR